MIEATCCATATTATAVWFHYLHRLGTLVFPEDGAPMLFRGAGGQ